MKVKRLIKNKSGSMYTDMIATCLCGVVVIAIGISVFSVIARGNTLMQAADNVKRIIETDGRYDTSEQTKISNYLNAQHISVTHVTVSPAKDRYALNERFTVTLSDTASIGGSFGNIAIPVTVSSNGACEVYNK